MHAMVKAQSAAEIKKAETQKMTEELSIKQVAINERSAQVI
jgi:hypothetical protein